jgi:hypothetical protein
VCFGSDPAALSQLGGWEVGRARQLHCDFRRSSSGGWRHYSSGFESQDESDAGSDGEALQDGALAAAALRMLTDSQLPVVEAAVHALRQLTSATTGGAATLRAAGASTQLHESTRALRQRATEGAEGLVEWVEELTSELERLVAELDGDS